MGAKDFDVHVALAHVKRYHFDIVRKSSRAAADSSPKFARRHVVMPVAEGSSDRYIVVSCQRSPSRAADSQRVKRRQRGGDKGEPLRSREKRPLRSGLWRVSF